MDIAFCINRLGIIGLGVTISSLIRNCSDQKQLKLWFFCSDLSAHQKNEIKRLLSKENFTGSYLLLDFNPVESFGFFNPLHGDWTAYGRLLLVDFIDSEQV
ncbi:MAG: glycosyltransferase family 8 protein, partial [Daejeonella sp.]|nr:glycosyltransferase family 8 protein [Daejeonella sp.]